MKNEKNKKNKKGKNIVGVIILIVAILLLAALILWNTLRSDTASSKITSEAQRLELFSSDWLSAYESIDSSQYTSVDEYKYDLTNSLNDVYSQYAGNDAVDAYVLQTQNTINGASSISDLSSTLSSLLDIDIMSFVTELLGGSSSSNSVKTTLTLASTTACNSVADSKYCLDGSSSSLNANVYVSDSTSTKWVVLVHPFMTSGSLIYSSLGSMYEAQGYNVLAPDLRGFGDSDGSVAMGYLESLDVYDWIKDLNINYSTRYGVDKAPDTIIVHGVSLGAATTLQLATNPDIAAAKGAPYTKTLTDLNVKGFVDDCGYTSMSGIITGMFSVLDISSLTSLLGSLGIDTEDFMEELQNVLDSLGVSGFESFDLASFSGIEGLADQFTSLYEAVTKASSGSNVTSVISGILDKYLGNADMNSIVENYGSFFDYSSTSSNNNSSSSSSNNSSSSYSSNNSSNDWWSNYFGGLTSGTESNNSSSNNNSSNNWGTNSGVASDWSSSDWSNFFGGITGTSSTGNSKLTLINNSTSSNKDNFLDGIIGTVLMNLVGVGLTEDNYEYYSNAFADGRDFPSGTKILVIHGTSDTTVPHSNADAVAAKAGNKLFYQWNAEGNPHAFVIVGTDTEQYKNLVAEFTNCIDGVSCTVTPLN